MYAANVLSLIGLLAAGAFASDVYSTFHNSRGVISPNFDVSNRGCFSIDDPTSVSFNQKADGPYCLNAFSSGFCPSGARPNQQTFESLTTGHDYSLNNPGAASYMWNLGACNA